jgi:hypothetical protein
MGDLFMSDDKSAAIAASLEPPPGWLSQSEVCKVLGKSKRRLNELIESGLQLEKREVRRPRRRPAIYYHPGDVERIRTSQEPKAPAFSASSGVGPRPSGLVRRDPPQGPELPFQGLAFLGVFDRAVEVLERKLTRPRGRWLTTKEAAAYSGLSAALMRAVGRLMLQQGSSDVIRDRGLKIRKAAIDDLTAGQLRDAAAALRQAKGAQKKLSTDEAEDAPRRPKARVFVAGAGDLELVG